MEKIKLIDSAFSHSILGYCSDFQRSELFYWDRNDINQHEDIVVYTDSDLYRSVNNGKSYAWLIEPMCINRSGYDYVINNKNNFKKIFTHEKELLDLGDPFKLLPFGCCWVAPDEQKVYDKTKNLSIISSNKTSTDGHRLRHEVISKYKNNIDVYGRGYNNIEFKIDGLKEYRFQIVIENCKRDYWFTEKLIDCFRTGTIPIYWGCPSIGDFFDIDGIITFDSVDDLTSIIYNLNEDLYNSKIKNIINNFEKSKHFILPDELIFKNIYNNE
jgi:hypothetical protein